MDDLLPKIFGFIALLIAIIFDWPRAVTGALLGFVARYASHVWLVIPAGIAVIAGLGELLYPLVGFSSGMSWQSFGMGLITSGATALAVSQGLGSLLDGGDS